MDEPEFYRFNSLALTVKQYYEWQGPTPSLALLLLQKLLRIRVPNVYWPNPSLVEVLEHLPASVAGHLARALANQVAAEGFEPFLCYRTPTMANTEGCTIALRGPDRRIVALAAASISRVGGVESRATQLGCLSLRPDGTEIGTTDARPFLPRPPWVTVERYPGQSPRVIIERHRARILGEPIEVCPTDGPAYLSFFVESSRKTIAFLQERGILTPMSAAEVTKIKARRTRA